MSAAHATTRTSQPFQCPVCQSRFTRHENLKRHAALHNRSPKEASLPCGFCPTTFSRLDLRRRHIKRKHPEHEERKSRDSSGRRDNPARHLDDLERGIWQFEHANTNTNTDTPSPAQTTGRKLGTPSFPEHLDTQIFDTDLAFGLPDFVDSPLQDGWYPSSLQLTRGCELYFAHVSPFVPFLHQPTFDVDHVAPLLVLSMLSLGYQYGDDPEYDTSSSTDLSTRCFHSARAMVSFSDQDTGLENVILVQAHLLLQICAMMYLCGEHSTYGLKIHSNMISLVRAEGLMAPAPTASATELESLWRDFIKTESLKRTAFAVHQIDALWYQLLSIPRSISHLEIKHELPSPEGCWTAVSSVEWAHRQLVLRSPGPVKYTDAVRRFLSNTDIDAIPRFDPYGAINITQFLLSSAREISGWSAMTGMLSMDRFSALRSSLVALGQAIRDTQPVSAAISHAGAGATEIAVSRAEATWETAMIELHMWSPSHTGGIVETSIDAALTQITTFPSYGVIESSTASAIQPHVDWFLRYLNTTQPESEAPWITFYAYKAFLIAWQLHRRVSGAMQVVGVQDGDVQGALSWARGVFERRIRWQLGRLILSCIDKLSTCPNTI